MRPVRKFPAGKSIVKHWIQQEEFVDWVEPNGGTTCFARVDPDLPIDYERFYEHLLEKYGTYVGPGHWFGLSKNYMRMGFAWNDASLLRDGLRGISQCLKGCM